MQYVVAGGLVLLAGLWVTALAGSGSGPWLAGAALAALGVGGLLAGIRRELSI